MNEVKELLEGWANDGKAAYDAIVLLVAKVEELEAQVQALSE